MGDNTKLLQIFAEAFEIESPIERRQFLDGACDGDDKLRSEVERLLKSHQAAGSFMERPIAQVDEQALPQPPASGDAETKADSNLEGPSSVIGPYKLLQLIGEGGMGSVYMAEQEKPVKRRVALKVIKAGMDTKQVIARFEAERQALAMMDHPSIARLLDVGTTDSGRPYFVMELVKGVPITEYCDQKHLSIPQRLELFGLVCHAVQHAHQKGIIHRDIKPSNILITQYDEKVVPKIIDFGLAKALGQNLTDKTMFTQFGQIMGTLAYMSPEQSKVNALDIDTRADIYSLGVLLYELLTGTTPFDKSILKDIALDAILKTIREKVPPKPSTRLSSDGTDPLIAPNRNTDPIRLGRIVRGDLDWIVMKALEKERSRRYESASGFADDIERYLTDEPVVARPPSTGYRIQKFFHKNQGLVVSVSAMLLLLLVGLAGTAWFAYQANELAKVEKAQREIAQEKTRVAEQKTREAEVAAKRSEDVLKIVTDSFRSTNPYEGGTVNMSAKEVLFNAQKAMDTSELDEKGKPFLLWALGVAFGGLGETDSAISIWEEVLLHSTEKLGPDHQQTLDAMTNLANSYGEAGRRKEALQLREKVLSLSTEKLGADHPDTLSAMNSLAASYDLAGRLDEALQLYKKVLPLSTEKLGADHPDTLSAMNNLAASHKLAGRVKEAMNLREKVLSLRTKKLGPDHPHTLGAMTRLADSYLLAGRSNEAVQLAEKVLSLRTDKLGADHPNTLRAMTDLATVYQGAGRWEDAQHLQEKVLPLKTAKLGPDHPHTLLAMSHLASTYLNVGRVKEAQQLGEKVLGLKTRKLGAGHQHTITTMTRLATIYYRGGQWEKALQLREKILPLAIELLGDDHPDTMVAMTHLALSYRRAKRDDEALVLQEKVLPLKIKKLGEDHPFTLTAMSNLAYNLSNNHREEEGLDLANRLVEIEPNNLSFQVQLGGMLSNLAEKEMVAEKHDVARNLLKRAIEVQKRVLEAEPRNQTSREFLGVHYDNLLKVGQDLDDPALIAEAEQGLAELESASKGQ